MLSEEGNKWKAKVLQEMYPHIQGIVDDNPGLVDYINVSYEGTIFLYDNNDHPKKKNNIIPCPTWNDVVNNVKEVFENKLPRTI